MSKLINTILIIILAIILTFGSIWYEKRQNYYGEKILIGSGKEPAAIYIEPDNSATRAAANYLAYGIEEALGAKPEIVTEKEKNKQYICLLCEEYPLSENTASNSDEEKAPAEPGQENRAEIILATAVNAGEQLETNLSEYSMTLVQDGVVIRVPERANCLGAAKAVSDRWLQQDCGLENAGELRISNRMICEQLSGLPVELTGEIKILTQNLRYIDDAGGNSVEERSRRFVRLIQEYQPDLIGTQECTLQWLDLLKGSLSDKYEFFGCSRLGSQSNDEEWNAILYRKDRFTLVAGDTFWLSNTPGTAATKLNYEGCVRICTWGLLEDSETEKSFLFSNTHLQEGETEYYREVRARQAETLFWQLRKGADKLREYPGFLTGDFNGESDEPFYTQVTNVYQDAKKTAIDNVSTVDYSFHAYGDAQALIDYCFHSPENITVLDYRILDDQYGGYISDHYGVLVTALLNGGKMF